MASKLMAVDVGLNALGWARWDVVDRKAPTPPTHCGVIEVPSSQLRDDFDSRARWIMCEFTGPWSIGGWPSECVVEWPEFRAGDAVGHAAASSDSLGVLYYMCGQHARLAHTCNCKMKYAPVSEWKGQLPKRVVAKRIARAIGAEAEDGTIIETHAWDAVGIGLWAQGHGINGRSFR